jgi:hypothetical protein
MKPRQELHRVSQRRLALEERVNAFETEIRVAEIEVVCAIVTGWSTAIAQEEKGRRSHAGLSLDHSSLRLDQFDRRLAQRAELSLPVYLSAYGRGALFVATGLVWRKECQCKFNLQRLVRIAEQLAKVKAKTGNDCGSATCRRYQPQRLESTRAFIEDGPLRDLVPAAENPQVSRSLVPGIAKTHFQEIHSSIRVM